MNHFDKYGGVKCMTLVIKDFYGAVLKHPKLMHYFSNLSEHALVTHQIKFTTFLMGKPSENHDSHQMKKTHQGRGISEDSFHEMAYVFESILKKHGVTTDDCAVILKRLEIFKSDIIEKPHYLRKVV
jgi:truncated hemoglobin YjbI